MAKKIVKKNKLKLIPVLILLLILFLLFLITYSIINIRIKNIYIHGNNNISDEYIIDLLDIGDYPSITTKSSWDIENKLKSSTYIVDAKVNKKFFGVLDIEIVENDVLFFKKYDNKYVFTDLSESFDIIYDAHPVVAINYIPDTEYNNFLIKFKGLSRDVIDKISEIKYDPTEYDHGRFLFYMIDGNYVYVTTTKLESLNYYNEIYPTLDGKKGTLYLDSGNHFQEF